MDIKQRTFEERHLNYWTYVFTYDETWFETFGECEYGYNSLLEVYKAIEEDKKINRDLMKSAIQEPKCYYHAMFYEWSDEDNCYYYTEYQLTTRKLKNGKKRIYAKEID